MTGHPIRRDVAVLCAAVLTAAVASTAFAADPEVAAKKRVVKCDGKVATKVGTKGPDRIRGTAGRDVVVGLAGNDVIVGLGGNDVICGGAGNDRIIGGPGNDKMLGQAGRDRIVGGTGADKLFGGLANDFLAGQGGPDILGGGAGSDRLDGGTGVDFCNQGAGRGPMVRCELPRAVFAPPAPPAPPAPKPDSDGDGIPDAADKCPSKGDAGYGVDGTGCPKPPPLHDLTGLCAVAYSDIDGRDGYSAGDRLIAKFVDIDGNGPDPDDKIVMGQYPKDYDATTFGDWTITEHTVKFAYEFPGELTVNTDTHSSTVSQHSWNSDDEAESFADYIPGADITSFQDGLAPGYADSHRTDQGSPSQPSDDILLSFTSRSEDNVFIDVELLCVP